MSPLKKVLSVLFIGAGLLACSEEKKLERRVVLHPNKAVWKEWNIERTPKGDTLIQGPYKEFFWNGSPAQSTLYKDGKKEGSSQAWYDNNALKWAKVYAADKPTAEWHLYTREGRAWMTIAFNDKGQIEGKVKAWDRVDASTIYDAEFKGGECVSGDCAVLNPVIPDDLPESSKSVLLKDKETVSAFLE